MCPAPVRHRALPTSSISARVAGCPASDSAPHEPPPTLGGGGHPPQPAQPRHTNDGALRTRKRHQQEHRPQRPTERSDPTQHAKERTGDCPGPREGATTRRNVTPPPPRSITEQRPAPWLSGMRRLHFCRRLCVMERLGRRLGGGGRRLADGGRSAAPQRPDRERGRGGCCGGRATWKLLQRGSRTPTEGGGGGLEKWAYVPRPALCVRTDVGAKGAGTNMLA